MRKIFALIPTLLSLVVSLQAQNVKRVTIGDNQNFGITYTLPKTSLRVTVKSIATTTKAGVYAPYAEKFLGLTDVVLSDQTVFEIETITLEDFAVPDNSRTFHVDFPEKGELPDFYLSEDGTLLGINRQPENKNKRTVESPLAEAGKPTLNAADVMTEEIFKAGSKAKQAELTAREIFNIRETRRDLLRGELDDMPKDGAAMKLVLDRLNAEEQAFLSLFVGTTTTNTSEKTFYYTPSDNIQNKVLFRFSSYEGIVDADDLLGEPYYISVNISEDKRMAAPVDEGKKKSQGIAYNVPGTAYVTITYNGQTLLAKDMIMGQFGHIEQLPVTQFIDKKNPAYASFNPLTGSITIYE